MLDASGYVPKHVRENDMMMSPESRAELFGEFVAKSDITRAYGQYRFVLSTARRGYEKS